MSHKLLSFVSVFLAAALAAGISTPVRGDVLVSSFGTSDVSRFSNSGTPLGESVASGNAGLTFASGLAVGPQGNQYVSSYGTGQILYYNSQGAPQPGLNGQPLGVFALLPNDPPSPTNPTGSPVPGALDFGPNGHLYAGDLGGNSIDEFSQTGAFVGVAVSVGSLNLGPGADYPNIPGGLSTAPNGDLLVGYTTVVGQGGVLDDHNGVTSSLVDMGDHNLDYAAGLLVANGNLYIADLFEGAGGQQILEYTLTPTLSGYSATFDKVFATLPPAGYPVTDVGPADLILGPDGQHILVAIEGENEFEPQGAILDYDLSGNLQSTFATGLDAPTGLVLVVPEPSASTLALLAAMLLGTWHLARAIRQRRARQPQHR